MSDCKPVSTPMEINNSPDSKEDTEIDLSKIPYQNAIGALLYLYQATRPDLGFAISHLSRYNKSYTHMH